MRTLLLLLVLSSLTQCRKGKSYFERKFKVQVHTVYEKVGSSNPVSIDTEEIILITADPGQKENIIIENVSTKFRRTYKLGHDGNFENIDDIGSLKENGQFVGRNNFILTGWSHFSGNTSLYTWSGVRVK